MRTHSTVILCVCVINTFSIHDINRIWLSIPLMIRWMTTGNKIGLIHSSSPNVKIFNISFREQSGKFPVPPEVVEAPCVCSYVENFPFHHALIMTIYCISLETKIKISRDIRDENIPYSSRLQSIVLSIWFGFLSSKMYVVTIEARRKMWGCTHNLGV